VLQEGGGSLDRACSKIKETKKSTAQGEQHEYDGRSNSKQQVDEMAGMVTYLTTTVPYLFVGNQWKLCWCDSWYGLILPPRQ